MAALGSWMARAGDGVNRFGSGDGFGAEGELDQRTVSGRELLYGTSFALTAGSAEDRGHGSLWGHASVAGFDGREDKLSLDGEVTTGFLGADWAAEGWTAGLALGHSAGTGGYHNGACAENAPADGAQGRGCGGRIEAELTGLYPYAGLDVTDRVSVWLAGGHGAGALTVVPDGPDGSGRHRDRPRDAAWAAAGTRIAVLEPEGGGGFSLVAQGRRAVHAHILRCGAWPGRRQPRRGRGRRVAAALRRGGLPALRARQVRSGRRHRGVPHAFVRSRGAPRRRGRRDRVRGGHGRRSSPSPLRSAACASTSRAGRWWRTTRRGSGSGAQAPRSASTPGPRPSGVSRCRSPSRGAPRPRAAWTRCSGARRWRGRWRTTTPARASPRRAVSRASSATGCPRSAAASRGRRTSGSGCPPGARATGASAGD